MYSTIHYLHSYWAYITLFMLLIAVLNALNGFFNNKEFSLSKDYRISLFALIFTHIQLLLGLIIYAVSPYSASWSTGGVMGDSFLRLVLVEHPFINIIAIALITMGWSRHKKVMESKVKFKRIAIGYGIGLVLILLRIPYDIWFK